MSPIFWCYSGKPIIQVCNLTAHTPLTVWHSSFIFWLFPFWVIITLQCRPESQGIPTKPFLTLLLPLKTIIGLSLTRPVFSVVILWALQCYVTKRYMNWGRPTLKHTLSTMAICRNKKLESLLYSNAIIFIPWLFIVIIFSCNQFGFRINGEN